MTPTQFIRILLRNEHEVLNVHPDKFAELQPYLKSRGYTYRPAIHQLKIKMGSQIHASLSDWAASLKFEGEKLGAFGADNLFLVSGGPLTGFVGKYQGITKRPNCALIPRGRFWPSIVFEIGYAQPYEDLKADVKLLLEGSGGKITKAILIYLTPLLDGQRELNCGKLEVWKLVSGKATKETGHRLYPIPKSHQDQVLLFSLKEIFRNKFADLVNEGQTAATTIPLRLDKLRTCIEQGAWRHLVEKGVIDEDDRDGFVFSVPTSVRSA